MTVYFLVCNALILYYYRGKITGEVKMLILTRRVGESLMIGDDVNVTVLGIRGNQVRLGVDAPKEIAVHREEIYERIQQEKAGDK